MRSTIYVCVPCTTRLFSRVAAETATVYYKRSSSESSRGETENRHCGRFLCGFIFFTNANKRPATLHSVLENKKVQILVGIVSSYFSGLK